MVSKLVFLWAIISDNVGFWRGDKRTVDVVTGKYLFIGSCRSLLVGIIGLRYFVVGKVGRWRLGEVRQALSIFYLSVTNFVFLVLELILNSFLLVGCSSSEVRIGMFAILVK